MDDLADLLDVRFEDTVCRGIRDHDRCEARPELGDLVANVCQLDVAVFVAGNHHDVHPGHHSAGRVGAVCARGDQADRTVVVASRAVVGADGKITTVAGSGKKGVIDGPALQAGLNGPKHLCTDGKNRVIIADAENHLIRLYDPADGSLKTILGSETKLNRPHGVTLHEGWLYIADSWNDRVLRIRW